MTQCYFENYNIKHIDYKNTELLKKFLNPHGQIQPSRRSGICAKHQRKLATAIKRSRYMGLLPYVIQ